MNKNEQITPAMIYDARFACMAAQNPAEYEARAARLDALEAAYARQCAARFARPSFLRRAAAALGKIFNPPARAAA